MRPSRAYTGGLMLNRIGGCAAYCIAAMIGLLAASGADAGQSLSDWLGQGTPVVDMRARYEGVDDKSKALYASAPTIRARLGFETAAWNGLSLAVDFDEVLASDSAYNSTRNGKTAYPTIGDPAMTALNRLQLTYATDFDTKIVVGRERLQFGDQRFIGNSGWRQHEQTFDALTLVNNSVEDLTLTYSYVERVNRVFGPNNPMPATGPAGHFDSNSHLFNAVYSGVPGLKLEGYAYLLKLDQKGPAASVLATSKLSTATYGVRAEYRATLSEGLTGQLNGAIAHQENFANNPLTIALDYRLAEGGLSYQGATALVGYEAMGGNGTVGFSTPFASLHPFDGLADMFLTTPVNGLDDFYLKASYAVPGFLTLKSLSASLVYHSFTTDRGNVGIGNEWDALLELAVDRKLSLLLGVADYRGAGIGLGGFKDKTVNWLQAAYKL